MLDELLYLKIAEVSSGEVTVKIPWIELRGIEGRDGMRVELTGEGAWFWREANSDYTGRFYGPFTSKEQAKLHAKLK